MTKDTKTRTFLASSSCEKNEQYGSEQIYSCLNTTDRHTLPRRVRSELSLTGAASETSKRRNVPVYV